MSTAAALPEIPTQLVTAAQAAFAALQEADNATTKANADALTRAMEAGDTAIALEEFAPRRGRQKFLKETTGAPLSTIKRTVTLAQGRAIIEAEMARVGQMSIRSALKLLRKPKEKKKKPLKPNPIAFRVAISSDCQWFFDEVSDVFLQKLSAEQKRWLSEELGRELSAVHPAPQRMNAAHQSPAYRPIPRTVREVNDDINRAIGALE